MENEDPTELLKEQLQDVAIERRDDKLLGRVALSAAILAVFAAIASLLAGHHVNEALISEIKAADAWAYYQAKGIKSAVQASKMEIISELGHRVAPEDAAKLKQYHADQEGIAKVAESKEKESEEHLRIHVIIARAVTMFQVAIAVSAIAALSRRRMFWYVGLAFGVLGSLFLIQGLL